MKLPMIAQVAGRGHCHGAGANCRRGYRWDQGDPQAPRLRRWQVCQTDLRAGLPSIFMQSLYTVYIVALNVILAGFFDGP